MEIHVVLVLGRNRKGGRGGVTGRVSGQSFTQRTGMLSADKDISLKKGGLSDVNPSSSESSSSASTGEVIAGISCWNSWMVGILHAVINQSAFLTASFATF